MKTPWGDFGSCKSDDRSERCVSQVYSGLSDLGYSDETLSAIDQGRGPFSSGHSKHIQVWAPEDEHGLQFEVKYSEGAGLSRDKKWSQLRYRGVNPLLQVTGDQEPLHRWKEMTPTANNSPRSSMLRSTRGFTLIEMVVALAVTAVIGYFFISIGRDFVRAWDNFGDAVSRETEARAALDLIARDFESAYFKEGTDHMLAVDVLQDNGNASSDWEVGPAERPSSSGYSTANHEYGWSGCWVRLFTSTPSLNAVGYQIIRSTIRDNLGTPRYMLYRNTTLTRDVVDNIENGLVDALDLTGSNALYDVGGGVANPKRSNILAVNVVDFGVRLYIYEPDPTTDPSDVDAPEGLRLIFPADGSSRLQDPIPSSGEHRASTFLGNTYSDRYPDVVEVFMRVLDENGADELSAMEERGGNAQWEEIVANNSKLYRRYIVVRGRSGL